MTPMPLTTSPRPRRRTALPGAGFTLIELLVVVGIIVLLMGLLATAVMRGIPLAQRSATEQWMSSIALAIQNYDRDVGDLPPEQGSNAIDRSNNLHQVIANPFRQDGRKYPAYITDGQNIAERDEKVVFVDNWDGVIDYRVDPDPDDGDLDLPEDYRTDQSKRVSVNAAPFILHSPGPDTRIGTSDDIIVTGN